MIANCPSCGTHYKHEPPKAAARARCGRCDATLDLSRLRPYRVVLPGAADPADTARAVRHLPIGLDHPGLATTIARNVAGRQELPQPVVAMFEGAPRDERAAAVDLPPMPAATTEAEAPTAAGRTVTDSWNEDDPLPSIPEMATLGAYEPSLPPVPESDILEEGARAEAQDIAAPVSKTGVGERATTFALWLTAGAIVGTGVSWTLGGTTLTGILPGGALGAVVGWGWVRWMSPR